MSGSPTLKTSELIGVSAAFSFVMQTGFFLFAYIRQTDSGTDFAFASNIGLIGLATLLAQNQYSARSIVITLLLLLWAIRLGWYLFKRIHTIGRDDRFDLIRPHFFKFYAFWFVQFISIFILTLPFMVMMGYMGDTLTVLDIIGWVISLIGFIIEAVSDQQKFNFKKTNKSFCNVGLWKYSRHPNYFGEMLFWWGLFISGIGVYQPSDYFCILSPLFITILLIFGTGINLLEPKSWSRYGHLEEYRNYVKTTSILILLPKGTFCSFPREYPIKSDASSATSST